MYNFSSRAKLNSSQIVQNTWGLTSSQDYVSPDRIIKLENILFEKIRQATNAKVDEGQTLYKAFKYYDLEEKGVVNLPQFSSVLVKFGCKFLEPETAALFYHYDSKRSGTLVYSEICAIMSLKGAGTNPNVNPVFEISKMPPLDILKKIIEFIKAKGIAGLRGLSIAFKYFWHKHS